VTRLETPRLVLEPFSVALARAVLDGDLSRLTPGAGWPHADTYDALRAFALHGDDTVPMVWGVMLRDTGEIVGDCGWYGPPADGQGEVEIGYGLAPAYRRRGYATEAVRALVGWMAAYDGVRRVVAGTETTNVASRRLLERLGFTVTEVDGANVRYALPVRRPR
jgi:ribosomal-protein-alanine N-acetyltransferase